MLLVCSSWARKTERYKCTTHARQEKRNYGHRQKNTSVAARASRVPVGYADCYTTAEQFGGPGSNPGSGRDIPVSAASSSGFLVTMKLLFVLDLSTVFISWWKLILLKGVSAIKAFPIPQAIAARRVTRIWQPQDEKKVWEIICSPSLLWCYPNLSECTGTILFTLIQGNEKHVFAWSRKDATLSKNVLPFSGDSQ